ncbi:uncharacterized protein C2F7.02c-like [Cryptomeria japonica]|uniref:uncharacterized protein C2F7.02c-like n=1 Tax=Cryptomeria japonica TaxID=3369 RepID=UPI0027D9F48C|nr:uncharacterized protein C2F7.02c-like [Cryptomeria japonica]
MEASSSSAPVPVVPFLLPKLCKDAANKPTLVLDMDHTLLELQRVGGPLIYSYKLVKRPGVEMFLAEMERLFEIVVFTASNKARADPLLDSLKMSACISHRLYREHCTPMEGGAFVKDLSLFGRDLSRVIIIDNKVESFFFHPSNAILIRRFTGNHQDRELENLIPFLRHLAVQKDVRPNLICLKLCNAPPAENRVAVRYPITAQNGGSLYSKGQKNSFCPASEVQKRAPTLTGKKYSQTVDSEKHFNTMRFGSESTFRRLYIFQKMTPDAQDMTNKRSPPQKG